MVLASVTFRALVVHTGAAVLRRVAIGVTTSAGAVLFLVCLLAPDHTPPLPLVWAPLAVMLGGLGMFLPASTAIVQAAGRRSAGTAAALGGGVPFFVGALTTPLTGLLGSQTVMTMASGTVFFYALALVAAWRFRFLTPDDRPVRYRDDDVAVPHRSSSTTARNVHACCVRCAWFDRKTTRPTPRRTCPMTQTVDALVTTGPNAAFERSTIDRRDPRPHDVVIDIAFAGICHSDIHQAREEWGRRCSRWCPATRSPEWSVRSAPR